ncbi:hypothetical protein A8B98_20185 [Hymenobacter sp. UV11]|nr:hypothetical protein A8B98_20185 [Hymenobacter sp. UV11]
MDGSDDPLVEQDGGGGHDPDVIHHPGGLHGKGHADGAAYLGAQRGHGIAHGVLQVLEQVLLAAGILRRLVVAGGRGGLLGGKEGRRSRPLLRPQSTRPRTRDE